MLPFDSDRVPVPIAVCSFWCLFVNDDPFYKEGAMRSLCQPAMDELISECILCTCDGDIFIPPFSVGVTDRTNGISLRVLAGDACVK